MKSLNDKSCVLDSFAYLVKRSPEELADYLGHDGSEHGFHTQEIIELSWVGLGCRVMEIQRYPVRQNPKTGCLTRVHFQNRTNDQRFIEYLRASNGILLGHNINQQPHAVAWLRPNSIYDPAIQRTKSLLSGTVSEPSIMDDWFSPKALLMVEKY